MDDERTETYEEKYAELVANGYPPYEAAVAANAYVRGDAQWWVV
jgi:hypothetical protein